VASAKLPVGARVWVADRARRGGSRQWQEVCNV